MAKGTQKELVAKIANHIRCIAIDCETIENLHLCNTISVLLDEINELKGVTDYDKERNEYYSQRLYKMCKSRGLYED